MKAAAFQLLHYITRPLIGTGLGRIKPLYTGYKIAMRTLIPEQSKVVTINGYKMHVRIERGHDIDGIAQHLIFDGEYDPFTTEVFKKIVKPKMVVLDIGANIGYYSLLALSLVGSNGKVWAFEPEPHNFANLSENVKLNGYDNIVLVNKAVSRDSGTSELYLSDTESGEHSLIPCRGSFSDKMMVATIRLDDMFGTNTRIDIIKSDTEGNDIYVLEGARDIINATSDIKVFTEFWPENIEAAGYLPEDYWNLLKALGFKYIYLLDEFEKQAIEATLKEITNYFSRYDVAPNLLCSKREVFI